MDRITQQFFRSITYLLIIFSTFTTFGQCNDSIRVVDADTCPRVNMSVMTFTELYKAKKNLDLISKELPAAKQLTDSLQAINDSIHENYRSEIDSTNKMVDILKVGIEDCSYTLAEVDIENMYLTHQIGKLRKGRKTIFGFGISIGVLGTYGAIKLFSK